MNSFVTRSCLALLIFLSSCLLAVRAANYVPKARATEIAAPAFSIRGTVFTNSFKVELKADDAVIRFSVDGSEPTTDSTLYKEPISISGCVLVRAKAWHR